MAKKTPNAVSQKQFKGEYVPLQPADGSNRAYKKEPNAPSDKESKKRNGVQLGSMAQANPGLVGMQDYKKKPKGK